MATLEEIEAAISGLPESEFQKLTIWFRATEQDRWDAQLDRDSASGQLDELFDEGNKTVLLPPWS